MTSTLPHRRSSIAAPAAIVPFALAALLFACAGCGSPAKKGESAEGGSDREPPRKVRVVRAEAGFLPRVVPATGTLAADERTELGFKVAGRVESVPVDLGSQVEAGQLLARLVPSDFTLRVAQAESALGQARAHLGLPVGGPDRAVDPRTTSPVRQAKAQLEQARVTLERVKTLFAQQLVAHADLDQAEADYGVADAHYQDAIEEAGSRQALLGQRRAELDLARQQLADSALRAPFSGAIEERRVSPGDYVSAGTPALVLVRIRPLRLQLAIPERESAGIQIGQTVSLALDDGRTVSGRVARLAPAIATENRTLKLEAEIPNGDGSLRPGAFVRAEIVTRPSEPSILVPAQAIVSFAGVDKVLSVDRGKAVEKRVRLGRKSGDRIEIVEGIKAGDTVIVDPGNLTEGQAVEVAS